MTTVLLDGNNLAMRSFHAARGSAMSSQGEDTGALQLFVNALSKHVREEQPDRLLVCWDSGRSQMRTQLLPEYKANRIKPGAQPGMELVSHEPLFGLIKAFLGLCEIPQWAQQGIEADDLIAAAWRTHEPGEKVVILSSDKDLMQLLDEDTEQVRFSSYGAPTDRWSKQRVITELGYRPDQIPLMMALTGDTSDNIPGMRGIGPKKALKMLQAASWDLDKALEPHPEHYSIVKRSLACVDLLGESLVPVAEVPLFDPVGPDRAEPFAVLASFCAHYEMRTILDRLSLGTLWTPDRVRSFEAVSADTP